MLNVESATGREQDPRLLMPRVIELERHVAIAEALQADPVLDGTKITVQVAEGRVTLDGTVAWDAHRVRAEQIARSLSGGGASGSSREDHLTIASAGRGAPGFW
jgi:hypothetical protein